MNLENIRQCMFTFITDIKVKHFIRENNITDQQQASKVRKIFLGSPIFRNATLNSTDQVLRKRIDVRELGLQLDGTYSALIVLAVVIILINAYIFSLFLRRKELRKKGNSFLISLCISDLLVGACGLPIFITHFKSLTNITLARLQALIIIASIGYTSSILNGLLNCLHLFSITVDRCFLLCYPFVHRTFSTKKKIVFIILLIWFTSFLLASISVLWWQDVYLGKIYLCDFIYKNKKVNHFQNNDLKFNLMLCCVFSILVFLKGLLFARIIILIVRRRKKTNMMSQRSGSVNIKKEVKAIIVLLMMFICLLSWLSPFVYYQIISSSLTELYKIDNISKMNEQLRKLKLFYDISIGRFLVSFLNPILYIIYKSDFLIVLIEDKDKCLLFITSPCRILRNNVYHLKPSKWRTRELLHFKIKLNNLFFNHKKARGGSVHMPDFLSVVLRQQKEA